METIEDKLNLLRNTLIEHPEGVPLIDLRRITGLSYHKIKNYVEEIGYEIQKKKFIRYRNVNVVVRVGGM